MLRRYRCCLLIPFLIALEGCNNEPGPTVPPPPPAGTVKEASVPTGVIPTKTGGRRRGGGQTRSTSGLEAN